MQIRHRYFPVLDPTQERPGRCYLLFFVYLFPQGQRYTYTDVHNKFPCHFFLEIVAWHCIFHYCLCKTGIVILFVALLIFLTQKCHLYICFSLLLYVSSCACCMYCMFSWTEWGLQGSGFTFIGCLLLTWSSGQCGWWFFFSFFFLHRRNTLFRGRKNRSADELRRQGRTGIMCDVWDIGMDNTECM